MYMYVNKRVELAQRGIALWKMYVFFIIIIIIIIIIITYSPAFLMHTHSLVPTTAIYTVVIKCTASTLE